MSNTLKYINIALESWGVIVCIAAIVVLMIETKIEKHTRNRYLCVFGSLVGGLLCNISGLLTKGLTSTLGRHLVRISNFGEFFFGFLIAFSFSLYILDILGGKENKKLRVWYVISGVIAVLGEVLIIISQFTGWIYYIDAESMYHRGELFWLSPVLGIVSLLVNISVVIVNRKRLKKKERTALVIYISIMVLSNLATLMFYGVFFTLLGSVLVVCLMFAVLVSDRVQLVKGSIRNKINYLVSGSMVTLVIFFLSLTVIISSSISSANAEIMMRESCQSLAMELNDQLNLVELAVNNIYDLSEKYRPSIDEMKDGETTERFLKQIEDIAVTTADNTDGAVAVYYRLNPDLIHTGTSGFFSVKSHETGHFESNDPTDLNAYDVNDVEHVGWYYLPVWAGKPVWVEPYYNKNINVIMVSYVIPIYDNNNLVGVLGMDVDFTKFQKIVSSLNVYKSSGTVICSTGCY